MEVTYRNTFEPEGYATAVRHARVLGELTRAAVWLGSPYGLRGVHLEPDGIRVDTARELHDMEAETIREGFNACLKACKGLTDPLPLYFVTPGAATGGSGNGSGEGR